MGRGRLTPIDKRGIHESRLTDKQRKFVAEYCVDYNAKNAAIRAGYPAKTAHVAAAKLMKTDLIMRAIGKHERDALEDLGIQKKEILAHLHHCATRNGLEFVDEHGRLLPINKLSIRAAACIDGIKQRERTFVDQNGDEQTVIETEYKLVGKASAIDMALKHLGAYAAQDVNLNQNINLNWNDLFSAPDESKTIDKVEYLIKNLEEPPAIPPEPDVHQTLESLIEGEEDE